MALARSALRLGMVVKPTLVITLAVVTEDEKTIPLVTEVFARAAAALGLEGLSVNMSIGTVQEDEASNEGN